MERLPLPTRFLAVAAPAAVHPGIDLVLDPVEVGRAHQDAGCGHGRSDREECGMSVGSGTPNERLSLRIVMGGTGSPWNPWDRPRHAPRVPGRTRATRPLVSCCPPGEL